MQVSLGHMGSVCPNIGGRQKELTLQATPLKMVWGKASSLPSPTHTGIRANNRSGRGH